MKILYLYNNPNAKELLYWLKEQGNDIVAIDYKIDENFLESESFDLIVSYTYLYIVPECVIKAVHGNAVNLHISYLPWNRGTNPNQWSWIENTPKGVTIHYMDERLDTGDIIAQELVAFQESETFASTYISLSNRIVQLFKNIYPLYPYWNEMRKKPLGKGSGHTREQFRKYKEIINDNYQMKISDFLNRIN